MVHMAYPPLRLFCGQDDVCESTATGTATVAKNMVSVPLAEILPLLADAFHSRRTWLRDFAHDDVTISSDLYEVLMAYRRMRRPSA